MSTYRRYTNIDLIRLLAGRRTESLTGLFQFFTLLGDVEGYVLLVAHPRITDDPARLRFVGFGAYSLDLEVFAYVDTSEWNEFLEIREDVYLRFMEAIKEAGTSFAFRSKTTYLGRDEGLNQDQVRQVEERVAAWRDRSALPFPHFSEDFRQEVENTLDWPPNGSPDARRAGSDVGLERSTP